MRTLFRRFLVLVALMFWQGGFTFYAAVVVPVGQEVLGSHREQGFITQRVTHFLNLAGVVALLPLVWDLAASRDRSKARHGSRWLAWVGMVLMLVLLVWLHPRLDELLDLQTHDILDRQRFRTEHRSYLWISTVQWACSLVYAIGALQAWRSEDWEGPRSGGGR